MPRKRFLLEVDSNKNVIKAKRPRLKLSSWSHDKVDPIKIDLEVKVNGEVGRLITKDDTGISVLIIQLNKCFTIGRTESCDYTMTNSAVSKHHCKLYALEADTGETIVGLQDISSNGTMHNNRRLNKQSVILNDGDKIEIGSQTFSYVHNGNSGVVGPATQEIRLDNAKVGDYVVFDRLLGSGAYSVIHLAFNTKTLRQVACKVMKTSRVHRDVIKDVRREVKILKTLQHPNINRVEDVVIDSERVHIFLQLLSGGDLFGYIIKHGKLSAAETKWIMYQLFIALDYLHSERNIAHRDLKIENILLDGPGPFPKVLLADFGQARLSDVQFNSLTGTPIYMAPEALNVTTREEGYDGKPADCWAIGCVLCVLLAGYHPFEDWTSDSQLESLSASPFGESAEQIIDAKKDRHTCYNILQGKIKLGNESYGSNDLEVRDLIRGLLAADSSKRLTAKAALKHPWFQQSKSELTKLYSSIVSKSS